jgi:hypothetical protein
MLSVAILSEVRDNPEAMQSHSVVRALTNLKKIIVVSQATTGKG